MPLRVELQQQLIFEVSILVEELQNIGADNRRAGEQHGLEIVGQQLARAKAYDTYGRGKRLLRDRSAVPTARLLSVAVEQRQDQAMTL